MTKKILITGGGGFIGSNLVENLIKEGKKLKVLIKYNKENKLGWIENLKYEKNLEIVFGDIIDANFVKNITKDCHTIINLAALIGIPYSYINPESYIKTNLVGTMNLLNSCIENSVNKFVHTSTSEVYGTAQYCPIDEHHPMVAQSPYAASKIAADQLCLSYYRSFNTPVSILRPFNTFGPRQSMRAVIPTIIVQSLSKNTISLGNIYAKRSFNYVDDTVDGFKKIINKKNNKFGEIYNIGISYNLSIKEVVGIVSDILGKKIYIKTDKSRIRNKKSEVMILSCNSSKFRKSYSWFPKYNNKSMFIKAIEKTIDWISRNKNQYVNYNEYNI